MNPYLNFTVFKSAGKLGQLLEFSKTVQSKHTPNGQKFAQSGYPGRNPPPGWPDEFVKNSAKIYHKACFVKIAAQTSTVE
jgi:hypothetical protein